MTVRAGLPGPRIGAVHSSSFDGSCIGPWLVGHYRARPTPPKMASASSDVEFLGALEIIKADSGPTCKTRGQQNYADVTRQPGPGEIALIRGRISQVGYRSARLSRASISACESFAASSKNPAGQFSIEPSAAGLTAV